MNKTSIFQIYSIYTQPILRGGELSDAIYKKSNETINGYLTLLIAENQRIIWNFVTVNEEEQWNIRKCKKEHISIFRKSSRWSPKKYLLSTQPTEEFRK